MSAANLADDAVRAGWSQRHKDAVEADHWYPSKATRREVQAACYEDQDSFSAKRADAIRRTEGWAKR